ncbi:hypothetical protein BH10ACI3_BH10ACI3_00930 [soil metagenome]
MHCPSCGQQQISNETKFCSRCGLPLGVVSEVLAYGGYLPQLAELNKKKKSVFSRRNGLAFSLLWFLFFLFILTPLWGILNVDKMAGASAVIGIFGAIIWMVSSFMFLKKDTPAFPPIQANFVPPPSQYGVSGQQGYQQALPPQQSVPISAYTVPTAGSWRDTNDLQAASVSEKATKLLEKEDN